ncbi:DUF4293 family protein [Sphingobacterium alkalisoli]|uniref:DUF4293 family protein n=1 Tax=Sphingobacterium alkalisoli TaxID=1874115 RepID=A0A4U0H894_9SPHI|nr:DUF4293 domain-containing protein [Sphingobacterium alkalisoli]TJY68011.1 DUF4293 family protein [Sphingobacterium alkalisoli]GGH09695.1 hypothetical protein GCM10011418_07790 [Sphingobacterium alkalisoli]
MIQRIQTIWLLLASLAIFGLFLFPYLNYNDLVGLGKKLYVTGSYTAVNGEPIKQHTNILQMIATIALGLFPIYIIFQFKNRKRQISLVLIEILLIVLFAVWLIVTANNTLSLISQSIGANNIGIGFFLLPTTVILLGMAVGGIRKDDKIIKSADRLR